MLPGISWLLAILWMAGILYTSSLGQAVTPVAGLLQTLVAKLGHIVEYGILGGLLGVAVLGEVPVTWPRGRLLFIAVLIGTVFAIFDELRQSFVPGREPRVTDVLIDLASVTVGAFVVLWMARSNTAPAVPSR